MNLLKSLPATLELAHSQDLVVIVLGPCVIMSPKTQKVLIFINPNRHILLKTTLTYSDDVFMS